MVLNHETYILDLVEANKGNVEWKFEYSAKVCTDSLWKIQPIRMQESCCIVVDIQFHQTFQLSTPFIVLNFVFSITWCNIVNAKRPCVMP